MYNKLNKRVGDDMTLGEIIKEYRISHSLSMDGFSKLSGISKAYISLLEKNMHPKTGKPIAPSVQCIKQAADGMGMDFNVLFSKLDGDVTLSDKDPVPVSSTHPSAVRIPVLGSVPAGIPLEAIEDVIDYEEIPSAMASKGDYFALKINGHSMEPQIMDGDVVIVLKTDDVDSGDIAIVMVNGDDATCKKILKQDTGVQLVPINPDFDPLFFTNKEIASKPVRIIGRVSEIRRTL